jgi:predicted patatin/cPLA2 family phospholipase
MSDSIPLKYFQNLGYEHNIVILTQPKGFTKKRTKLMPLFHALMRKYPAVIEIMNRRHIMYNAQLEYLAQEEKAGHITIIAPDETLPIGRTEQNVEKMKRVYQMGREAAEKTFKLV